MTTPIPTYAERHRRWIAVLTVAISLLFFLVIRGLLITMLMAAIAAALANPLYDWLRARLGRLGLRRPDTPATVLTLLAVLLLILVPLASLLGIVAEQAIGVSQRAVPWIQAQAGRPDALDDLVRRVPMLEGLLPYKARILEKLGELAGALGGFLARQLAAVTRGAVTFVFHLFVMLYAMFFFLRDGRALLAHLRRFSPLPAEDKQRLLEKFVSVSRATIKGTLVIGLVQGTLGGLAIWAAGIAAPVFWGAMIVVLSIIPGLGSAIVWVPGALYLALTGRVGTTVAFVLWFVLVVGVVDNFLRPRLVGKDTKMPDLLILLSTLGGIAVFGPVGLLVGPIIAALFLTIWDMYGVAFQRGGAAPAR